MLATRGPRRDHPLESLEVVWQQRATQIGPTQQRLDRLMGRSRQVTPADPGALFEQLATPHGLTAQTSSFAKPEVVNEIAASQPEGATRQEIEELAEAFLHSQDVIELLANPRHRGPDWRRVSAAQPICWRRGGGATDAASRREGVPQHRAPRSNPGHFRPGEVSTRDLSVH